MEEAVGKGGYAIRGVCINIIVCNYILYSSDFSLQ